VTTINTAINPPSVKTSSFTDDLNKALSSNNAYYRIGLMNYMLAYNANVIDKLSQGTNNHNQFFKDMTDLDALIASCVKAGEKGESVEVNFRLIREKISALRDKYALFDQKTGKPNPLTTLYTATETGEQGRQQALDWAKSFGFPDSAVHEIPGKNGEPSTYFVSINTGPLDRYNSLYSEPLKEEKELMQVIEEARKFGIPGLADQLQAQLDAGIFKIAPLDFDQLKGATKSQFDVVTHDNQLIINELSKRLQRYNNIATTQVSTSDSFFNALKAYIF